MVSFLLTRTFTFQQPVRADLQEVVSWLHNAPFLIKLNPLVTSVELDPSQPNTYLVTERLPIVGSLESHTTSRCSVIDHENGVEHAIKAGFGTSVTKRWRVEGKAGVEDLLVVQEVSLTVSSSACEPGSGV
ncbi:hypothetical protein BDN72DRAFT_832364 [Pluteus cervinus]|uniref:Uncharacterized protein n=1 Tax=Pluteus cervinus TaxID=181527 RepID=A0ACD3BBQ7_9AGAR|nr:hypothetical protein BDN72DRAFT_832364 [Pluteus cervinus]